MTETNATADRIFLDTNVLVYLYSENEPDKREIAVGLVEDIHAQYVVSTQVLGEFANTMLRKFGCEIESIKIAIQDFKANFEVATIQMDTIDKALSIIERHHFSYWDSVIISSALENFCTVLFSEDLHHRQVVESRLEIINPFLQD